MFIFYEMDPWIVSRLFYLHRLETGVFSPTLSPNNSHYHVNNTLCNLFVHAYLKNQTICHNRFAISQQYTRYTLPKTECSFSFCHAFLSQKTKTQPTPCRLCSLILKYFSNKYFLGNNTGPYSLEKIIIKIRHVHLLCIS